MYQSVNTHLFLALPCEAKPLIAHFALKKTSDSQIFDIYQRDNMTLTITGMGKSAMAVAVGYTLGIFNSAPMPVCINIGIAGHQQTPVGSLLVADKITDQDTGKHFYPQLAFANKLCPGMPLRTVSQAQVNYAPNTLYDMEASAFYESASCFTSSELLLSLKIISDNENAPVNLINAKQVSAWIAQYNHVIADMVELIQQRTLQASSTEPNAFNHFTNTLHLSVSEKIQLKALLNRWQVMSGTTALPFSPTGLKSARELLTTLTKHIEELPVYL